MRSEPILLLTRPIVAAQRFLDDMPADARARVHPILSPVIEIVPVSDQIDTGPARALIFTSRYGVQQAAQLGVSTALPVYTIGTATAKAAQEFGWHAQCMGRTSDELVENMLKIAAPSPLLHLHGRHTTGDIAARLSAAQLPTQARAIYDQRACPLNAQANAALTGDDPVIVPLFSPRSAKLFSQTTGITAPINFLAFSPAVANHIIFSDTSKLHICAEPTASAMHAALCDIVNQLCRVEGYIRRE